MLLFGYVVRFLFWLVFSLLPLLFLSLPPFFSPLSCSCWSIFSFPNIQALELLPPDTPIQELYGVFESVIRENSKTRRNNQVVKNLLKAENLQVRVLFALFSALSPLCSLFFPLSSSLFSSSLLSSRSAVGLFLLFFPSFSFPFFFTGSWATHSSSITCCEDWRGPYVSRMQPPSRNFGVCLLS